MNVQDPFELSHNVTAHLPQATALAVVRDFQSAADIMRCLDAKVVCADLKPDRLFDQARWV